VGCITLRPCARRASEKFQPRRHHSNHESARLGQDGNRLGLNDTRDKLIDVSFRAPGRDCLDRDGRVYVAAATTLQHTGLMFGKLVTFAPSVLKRCQTATVCKSSGGPRAPAPSKRGIPNSRSAFGVCKPGLPGHTSSRRAGPQGSGAGPKIRACGYAIGRHFLEQAWIRASNVVVCRIFILNFVLLMIA
jgi:hypothetical protein